MPLRGGGAWRQGLRQQGASAGRAAAPCARSQPRPRAAAPPRSRSAQPQPCRPGPGSTHRVDSASSPMDGLPAPLTGAAQSGEVISLTLSALSMYCRGLAQYAPIQPGSGGRQREAAGMQWLGRGRPAPHSGRAAGLPRASPAAGCCPAPNPQAAPRAPPGMAGRAMGKPLVLRNTSTNSDCGRGAGGPRQAGERSAACGAGGTRRRRPPQHWQPPGWLRARECNREDPASHSWHARPPCDAALHTHAPALPWWRARAARPRPRRGTASG